MSTHAPQTERDAGSAGGPRQALADHLSLTKPRIVELLLVTTVPAMVLANGGWPGVALPAGVVLAGALTAGAAHGLNMVVDTDLDALMDRTRDRPLPSGRMSRRHAVLFAAALAAAGLGLMLAIAGGLAAALNAVALAWYVGIYTCWLKRRTDQNIVIGGVAGAIPPMIGWAAVTGDVSATAVALFGVVVLWTPPHFWALAVAYRDDYARAGVPMLPVTRGVRATANHITWYAAATVACSLVVPLTSEALGWPVVAAVAAAGAWFVRATWRLRADPTRAGALHAFKGSITYLAALFGILLVAGLLSP